MTSEREIEKYLVREVERIHGLALKWLSPGWSGAPDRIVLLPGGRIFFVELKAPKKVPRKLQIFRIGHLRALGFTVAVIDSKISVDEFVLWCKEVRD